MAVPSRGKASRQGGVTLSSSEAELVAASQPGQEVLYLREKYFTLGRLSKGLHTYSMVLQRFGKAKTRTLGHLEARARDAGDLHETYLS